MTPEEKRRAAELLRYWANFAACLGETREMRDLAAKLEAEANG